MRILGNALRALLAFFVDDGMPALLVLAWLALVWLSVAQLRLPARWSAPLLFVGLAGILGASAWRRSRPSSPSGH